MPESFLSMSSATPSVGTVPLIQPIGVKALYGLALQGDRLLAVDPFRGYLLRLDPQTDQIQILNSHQAEAFYGVTGIACWQDQLWFCRDHTVYTTGLDTIQPAPVLTLPYSADGVAVWENTLYVSCKKGGCIFVCDRNSGQRITQFSAPGIGIENISVWDDYLWVCDQIEQTVYCLDRATGELVVKMLTPFATPTGIAVPPHTAPESGTLWVAYTNEEPYVREDPNGAEPYVLTFRDRTLIHPLTYRWDKAANYCRTNGYLVEMTYVEEIDTLEDAIPLENVEWRIAFPTSTDRQRVKSVEPVGLPFTELQQNGERLASFRFDRIDPNQRHLFGWKALVEVYGIKYQLTPRQVESAPTLPPEYGPRYLIDDDELAMDTSVIQAAARDSVGSETNLLRRVLSIRNYVYDKLSYAVTPAIDPPDVVLTRGRGSCGEYVGLLLALMRLNGIACRTVGRYKCPAHADQPGLYLEPDFNHVWIEFYIPGFGWVPMESNPDDVQEGGPYPTRFFMGLPWWHVEMGKDISFEKLIYPQDNPEVRLGDLAVNHMRFKILGELAP
ncbi:transglutaminase-like domain-containing protein [Leptolyngbya sp. KIOST-1]|uniref:transglutaminase-like domain-containing protein n=1 Tax=Leptolyngbya sp. KIOST-1 TaxID=1229172 RepID=UPI000B16D77A|nr:transglutaminase family protein [Leptolyngbya sp. KIOST-1]